MTATGNLTVTANGAITQAAGANIVNNTAGTVATFNASSANNITLGATTNDFTEIRIAAGNIVQVRDGTGLNIGVSTVSGNFDVLAVGNVNVTGNLALNGANSVIYANGSTADLTVSSTITHNNAAAGVLDLRADNSVFMTAGSNIAGLGGGALQVTLNSDRDGSGRRGDPIAGCCNHQHRGQRLAGRRRRRGGLRGRHGRQSDRRAGVEHFDSPPRADTLSFAVMAPLASGHGVWVGSGANLQVGAGNATLTGHALGNSQRGVFFGEGDTVATLGGTGGAIVIQGNSGAGVTGAEIGVQLGQSGTNPIRITNTGRGHHRDNGLWRHGRGRRHACRRAYGRERGGDCAERRDHHRRHRVVLPAARTLTASPFLADRPACLVLATAR